MEVMVFSLNIRNIRQVYKFVISPFEIYSYRYLFEIYLTIKISCVFKLFKILNHKRQTTTYIERYIEINKNIRNILYFSRYKIQNLLFVVSVIRRKSKHCCLLNYLLSFITYQEVGINYVNNSYNINNEIRIRIMLF